MTAFEHFFLLLSEGIKHMFCRCHGLRVPISLTGHEPLCLVEYISVCGNKEVALKGSNTFNTSEP